MTPPATPLLLLLLEDALATVFAPWIREMGLTVREARVGQVTLAMPIRPAYIHVGGVMCGQAAMAAADTAMVLAMVSQLGEFRPMTTVQLQTSFLRPLAGEQATVTATVLRSGRSLAFGSIDILDEQGRLAVQATTTYALL